MSKKIFLTLLTLTSLRAIASGMDNKIVKASNSSHKVTYNTLNPVTSIAGIQEIILGYLSNDWYNQKTIKYPWDKAKKVANSFSFSEDFSNLIITEYDDLGEHLTKINLLNFIIIKTSN